MLSANVRCGKCGVLNSANARYCGTCGTSLPPVGQNAGFGLVADIRRRCENLRSSICVKCARHGLYRESRNKSIAGVCACVARLTNVNVLLVRCITVSLVPLGMAVCIFYAMVWFVTEERR